MVRRGAGFDTNQTPWQLLKKKPGQTAASVDDGRPLGRQRQRREPGKLI
jgi:hypothetical protein